MTDNMTHLDFRNTSAVTRFSEIVCNKNETAVMMTFARLSCWHAGMSSKQQSTVNIISLMCPGAQVAMICFSSSQRGTFPSFYVHVSDSGCVCVWYQLWDINYSCLAKQTTRTRLSNAI